MAAEEGHLVGHATPLIDGDDGEGASSGSFPIHCDVFGVGLHQVGVPGVLRNAQIIVALFLGEGLADVWWAAVGARAAWLRRLGKYHTFFVLCP